MPAEVAKLIIEQGANFSFVLTRKYEDGTPINFTGFTARMQIRKQQGAPILVSATTENGKITIPVGTDGRIVVNLGPADTTQLKYTRCAYDLEAVGPGGVPVLRLMKGPVEVDPNITQEAGDPVVMRA